MLVKAIYIVFIGLLLALFVGVGISAFYPGPKSPEQRGIIYQPRPVEQPESTATAALREKEDLQNQSEWRNYTEQQHEYSKNVSIIVLASAVTILTLGLLFSSRLPLISDGFLLGSALTLLYSIVRSFDGGNSKIQFLIIAIGLAISLAIGYWKFIRKESSLNP